jgi:LacI family transcriptional regulator
LQAGPQVVGILCNSFGDPYSIPILHGAAKKLASAGFHTIFFVGGFPKAPIYQDDAGALSIPPELKGMILLSATLRGYGHDLLQLAADPRPVVSIGADLKGASNVSANDEPGVFQAIAHLVKRHDRKRIAFIAGPEESVDGARRLDAYRLAIENFGLTNDPTLVVRGDYEARSGRDAAVRLRRHGNQHLDAIVAANDLMAIGAIEGLQAAGIEVPRNVAVIGFDDMEEAAFTSPSLTTIRQPVYEQGLAAARALTRMIEGDAPDEPASNIATPLVIRRSCGCAGGDTSLQRAVQASGTEGASDQQLLEDAARSTIRRLLAEQRGHRELSRLADAIIGAADLSAAAPLLTEVMRILRFERFMLCTYSKNRRQARVVLESRGNDVVFLNRPQTFPVGQLLPTGLLKKSKPLQLVIEPLYIGDDQLGYSIIQTDVREGRTHLELRHFLSAALGRMMTTQEIRRLYVDGMATSRSTPR